MDRDAAWASAQLSAAGWLSRNKGWYAPVLVGMLALGMGNGSVFQLVPQRFRSEIGVMTGLVGMTGGIGGFYLASSPVIPSSSPEAIRRACSCSPHWRPWRWSD